MARPPKEQTTAVTNWDEEMARQAAAAAKQEAHVGGGKFFSTRAGVLACDGQQQPNNEMVVVIVDGILENVWYAGKFDPDNIESPACFAFGREDPEMEPHAVVKAHGTAQSETCSACPKNEFGSSDTGRGKACQNRRRLALLPGGKVDPRTREFTAELGEGHYTNTEMRYLKVPPTSLGAYAAYVKQLAGGLKRPPHGVFTKVTLRPHATKQFEMLFEAVAPVPGQVLGAIMERHARERDVIDFPYQPGSAEPAPKAAAPTGRKFQRR